MILCFCPSRLFCQPPGAQIAAYNEKYFNEELYVQTDRDLYISGEKVFFKIYCLDRLTHKPSPVSKVVYVSLLDNSNDPVVQVKIEINGSFGSGQFVLPETISTGNYYISSCTRWMQNFSPELYSYKTISVINPFENPGKAAGDTLPQIRSVLPAVVDSGISLSIESLVGDQKFIRLRINKSAGFTNFNKRFRFVYLLVSMSPFVKEFDPDKETEINLARNTLPPGLANVMIIDDNEQVLTKRLIYNMLPEVHFSIRPEKTDYSTREKVRIEISATDTDGNPVEGDIMVSVVKSFSEGRNDKLLSNFIQLPGAAAMNYAAGSSDIDDQFISVSPLYDLLPHNNAPDKVPEYLPELERQLVSGNIHNTVTGEPLKNENIVLSFVGKAAQCIFTKTDNDGRFNFLVNETGKHEIVIQPLRPELTDYYIELNDPFPEVFSVNKPAPLLIDTSRLAEINNAIISMQVQAVYEHLQDSGNIDLKGSVVHNFYGEPDLKIDLSTYIELTSLHEIFKELVPGVVTYTRKDKSDFGVYSYPEQTTYTIPLVLVDGVPVHDHDAVLKIKPGDIEQIKVFHSKYFVSDMMFEGIVDFNTKQGNLRVPEFDKPVFRQEFDALQPASVLHFPDYSSVSQKESRIPDFRNTLYWDPDIKTDRRGKAIVEFYTSDEPGNYNILVEGFTSEGCKGSAKAPLSVSNKQD